MPIVDQFNDPAFGTLVRQLERMPALESLVKEAEVDASEARDLPDSAFAWPEERKFPLHTREHAALSYAYLKCASEAPAEVRSRAETALTAYDIPSETFTEVATKTAEVAAPAYVLPEFKYLPLVSLETVKAAQMKFVEDISKLDQRRRNEGAERLAEKAAEFKTELHPRVEQLAGLTLSNTKTAAEWVEARASLVPEGAAKTAYESIAAGLRRQPLESRDTAGLRKVAALLERLDAENKLTRFYDRKLPDARQTVFNTMKTAAATVDVDGMAVPLTKLARLPASFWEDLGGPELAREVAPGGTVDSSKLAAVVETLPLDLKVQLKAYCR